MCIIATKNYGVDTLDWDVLETCFLHNPDGAGYAYTVKGGKAVRYRKGFMTFSAFRASLQSVVLDKYSLADLQLLLHFRITTHGGTRAENTHPFAISVDSDKLKALRGVSDSFCAMNGIVDVDIPKGSTMSDTMHYIASTLSFMRDLSPTFYKRVSFAPFIRATGCKWSFIDMDGIYNYGDFNQSEGWSYSNYSYDDYSKWYTTTPTRGSWGTYEPYYSTVADYFTTRTADVTDIDLIEFEGVAYTTDGEMVEIDKFDDVFIGSDERLFLYNNDLNDFDEITNISKVYNCSMLFTNYNAQLER